MCRKLVILMAFLIHIIQSNIFVFEHNKNVVKGDITF